MTLDELYREELMEHYHNPRNSGKMADPDITFHDNNPVCGDEITMQATVRNGAIEDAKFTGNGCAISQAAASMLTEEIKGKKIRDIVAMGQSDMLKIVRINPGPVRIKCAMLGLRALQKGIVQYTAK